jgi:membrane protein
LALTFGILAGAASIIYLSVSMGRLVASQNSGALQVIFNVLAWPVAFCLCSAIVSLIYRYGPNRVRTPWVWITWGSAFASTFWLLGTWLFSWYAANFGSYNKTYGVFGGLAGFLTWIWLSVVLLLTGAEIICELERKRQPKPGDASKQPKEAKSLPGRKAK